MCKLMYDVDDTSLSYFQYDQLPHVHLQKKALPSTIIFCQCRRPASNLQVSTPEIVDPP